MFPYLVDEVHEKLVSQGIWRTDREIDRAILTVWDAECSRVGYTFDLMAHSVSERVWDDMLYRGDGIMSLLEVDVDGDELVDRLADVLA
ncbi:hypothetical protein [Microbacterium sp. No. 7]|uniref:hypothetical protein n=1 Tax=Microbacterium sp. No. 7 TaxID=1714373 RepID=UPI0012E3117A|nr:hypothetical protein [Microbacterium sp. No. 7]